MKLEEEEFMRSRGWGTEMVSMPKMIENIIKAAIGKREIMERMNRVVGDPMSMIEVTRIIVLN